MEEDDYVIGNNGSDSVGEIFPSRGHSNPAVYLCISETFHPRPSSSLRSSRALRLQVHGLHWSSAIVNHGPEPPNAQRNHTFYSHFRALSLISMASPPAQNEILALAPSQNATKM